MSLLPECPRCFGLLTTLPHGYGLSSRCRCNDTPADTKAEAEYAERFHRPIEEIVERELRRTMEIAEQMKDAA